MTDYTVQRGTTTFGASGDVQVVTIPVAVDATRAFPRLTNVQHAGSGRVTASNDNLNNDDIGASITAWDGTTFTLTRSLRGEDAIHEYDWEVWEDRTDNQAVHGWYVRGIVAVALTGAQNNVSSSIISSIVDPAMCIPFPISCLAGSEAREWGQARYTAKIRNNKRVRIQRDATGGTTTVTAGACVVEFGSAWTVVRNLELTITGVSGVDHELSGAGSGTAWANKFVVPTIRSGDGDDRINAISYLVRPKDGDNDVILASADPARATLVGDAFVVCHTAHHPDMEVEHRTPTALLADEETDTTLVVSHSPADTGLICTTMSSGGTGYVGGHWSYRLLDKDTIRWRRGRTTPADVSPAYQAIRFPRLVTAGGGLVGLGTSPSGTLRGNAPRGIEVTATGNQTGAASRPDGIGLGGSGGARQ